MSYADECTLLYTRRGKVAHLRPPSSMGHNGALCEVMPLWFDGWLGTGSQAEYERAASLPLCSRCSQRAGGEDAYRVDEGCQFRHADPAENGHFGRCLSPVIRCEHQPPCETWEIHDAKAVTA